MIEEGRRLLYPTPFYFRRCTTSLRFYFPPTHPHGIVSLFRRRGGYGLLLLTPSPLKWRLGEILLDNSAMIRERPEWE